MSSKFDPGIRGKSKLNRKETFVVDEVNKKLAFGHQMSDRIVEYVVGYEDVDTNDDEYRQHCENLNARYDKNFVKGVCAIEKMPGISVFTHGQLYVAVNRFTSRRGLKIFVDDSSGHNTNITDNVVFKEVFYHIRVT
ncbi:uncharacterized protein LOC108223344 isoform X2 [Daucus carota subsp. sativus]|uniref:uncharacterized protein LOC108223344 isoform X2 n=1 Tax=Daucus carota subsp. sativus TaxID=79200 RepID=UPI003082CA1F